MGKYQNKYESKVRKNIIKSTIHIIEIQVIYQTNYENISKTGWYTAPKK